MLTAFALIAIAAQRQAPQERFSDLYLDETSRRQARGDRRVRRPLGLHVVLRGPRPARGHGDAQRVLRARDPGDPCAHGGEIDRLVGDAIVATFNTRGDQPDHAARAVARRARRPARDRARPGPRTPTGRASASASTAARRWSASSARARARATRVIGDTVNVAARLQGAAPVGGGRDRAPGRCAALPGRAGRGPSARSRSRASATRSTRTCSSSSTDAGRAPVLASATIAPMTKPVEDIHMSVIARPRDRRGRLRRADDQARARDVRRRDDRRLARAS